MNFQQKAKFLSVPALVCAGLVLAPAPQAQANLISNGGFESPVITANGGGYDQFPNGTTGLAWTGSLGVVEIQHSGVLNAGSNAYEGDQYGEVNSTGPASLTQSFASEVGKTYRLTFQYSARPTSGTNSAAVLFGATDTAASTVGTATDTAGSTIQWNPYTFYYTATSTTSYVGFIGSAPTQNDGSYGNLIDNVDVVATPEPETWAMMGLGLAAVAFMGWKRRKQSAEQAPLAAEFAL